MLEICGQRLIHFFHKADSDSEKVDEPFYVYQSFPLRCTKRRVCVDLLISVIFGEFMDRPRGRACVASAAGAAGPPVAAHNRRELGCTKALSKRTVRRTQEAPVQHADLKWSGGFLKALPHINISGKTELCSSRFPMTTPICVSKDSG